jgi:hypothetical protein
MARLRLSAHRLCIETGRFNGRNKYIPPEERTCQNCQVDETEDEEHFLVKCSKYHHLREPLFQQISMRNIHFKSYDDRQKFMWLLTTENLDELKSVANFINEAFKLRKS